MRSSILLASCVAIVQAWENTSPFLLFSNTTAPKLLPTATNLQSAKSVLDTTNEYLRECPSSIYLILSQPHLSPLDFNPDVMPNLFRASSSAATTTRYSVENVLAWDATREWSAIQGELCGGKVDHQEVWGTVSDATIAKTAQNGETMIILKSFDTPLAKGRGHRDEMLRNNDAEIAAMLRSIPEGAKYTVIYSSTPLNGTIAEEETMVYEPEFESQLDAHIDLKRSIEARVPPKTVQTDTRPLFEKYQFLTPGIFMGAITLIIMFMILSVGISAVSSLQVSYGAFDKENGPAAQKK